MQWGTGTGQRVPVPCEFCNLRNNYVVDTKVPVSKPNLSDVRNYSTQEKAPGSAPPSQRTAGGKCTLSEMVFFVIVIVRR